jgi:hypothetical protein
MALPVPAQDRLLLLRKSLQTQAHHLARCLGRPSLAALERMQDNITAVIYRLLQRDRDQHPESTEQMQLPLRLGSLGIHCLTDRDGLPCGAAFLSQAALIGA